MQCESCNAEISSKMKAAVKNNSCPYCNGLIMPPMKAEQYLNLVEVLEQTTFTNRSDVDAQIRDKVTGLLMNNFLFKRLELAAAVRDIIVLEDEDPIKHMTVDPTDGGTIYRGSKVIPAAEPAKPSINNENVQKVSSTGKSLNTITEDQAMRAPSRSVSDAAKTPRQTSQPISGNGLSAKDYAMAQDQAYSDDDSNDPGVDISDLAGLTPEEILTTFPELTTADIEGMISRTTSKLSQHPQTSKVQRGLTGNGIRRA
jgi:Zn-finger nucleic acid-binding protein